MPTILKVRGLSKTYQNGSRSLQVLDNIDFSLEVGESLAIVGSSGSGKTTLLGLAAGLDRPDGGFVEINQIKINGLSEDVRAQIRN